MTFPLRQAYDFTSSKGLAAEAAEIRAIPSLPRYSYNSGVRRAHMIELLKDKGLLDDFLDEHWPDGHTARGRAKMDLYSRRRVAYEALAEENSNINDDDEDEYESPESDSDDNSNRAFAYERDLQNYLAKNLEILEPGLSLFEDERGQGLEYPIDGGRIDLLAIDDDGRLVVIELKLSKGRSRAIGQLLYYMGWIDKNLNHVEPCRGILVAKDIGEDVMTAVGRTNGIELFQYKLQVAVEKLSDGT